jgi:hypothetical protein
MCAWYATFSDLDIILIRSVYAVYGRRHPFIAGARIRYQFPGANLRCRVFVHILRAFQKAEMILDQGSRSDASWNNISA